MKHSHTVLVLFTVVFLLTPSILGGFMVQSSSNDKQTMMNTSNYTQQQIGTSPVGGSRYNIQGWVYVNVKGDPYTRGYQYGYLIGEEIIDLMHRWSNMILNHPKIKPIRPHLSEDQYENVAQQWWQFCTNLAEQMYWDEYPEEYQQEMRGIAAGVTERGLTLFGDPISFKDVLASNEMYEMLSKITDRKIRKSIHPLLSFFALIQPTLSQYSTSTISADEFIDDFYPDFGTDTGHHHCSAFIATGDATKDNELIIANSMWSSIDGAGMWWWSYYIAIRWNIILDVIPTEGNRFQMSCAPGYIWSDHDFYQNENGIVFLETTVPQGAWKEKGIPLAVRARKAVQYANSIDDVIQFLKTDNDGVMNAVWLIGDTKTGEIARYELGLYQDAIIERTADGFQWSSNNPIDFGVRWEKMDWKLFVQQVLYHIVLGLDNYQYHTPWYLPASRDVAFEALGKKYYGSIDVETVKQIMSIDPIGTYSPDCKITTTSLLDDNGLIVHTGNPGGKTLSIAYFDSPDVYYDSLEPIGWVRLYGLPEDHNKQVIYEEQQTSLNAEEHWSTPLENNSNDFYSYSIYVDEIVYSTTNSGMLHAVSSTTGDVLWSKEIGNNPTEPVVSNHKMYIGSDNGLTSIDLGWFTMKMKPIGDVESIPVVYNDSVFIGTTNHEVMAIDQESGMVNWKTAVDGIPYLSQIEDEVLIVAAGKKIYGMDCKDGTIIWIQNVVGFLTSNPYQIDGSVYVGSWDTDLYVLDQKTGEVLWTFNTGWGIESTPIVTDNLVIFGSHDQNVYALNKDSGILSWMFSCKAGIHSNPLVWKDSIIIGSDDGCLYRLDKDSGSLLWCFTPGDTIQTALRNYVTTPIRSSVATSPDNLFIGMLGQLYSIS